MLVRVEVMNYRCLQREGQEIGRFNVLVGPNASGKSSFLDAVVLLRDALRDGVPEAILFGPGSTQPRGRARDIRELLFRGQGARFEVGVELDLPDALQESHSARKARYAIAIGVAMSGELGVCAERLWVLRGQPQDGEDHWFPLVPDELLKPGVVHSTFGGQPQQGWVCVVDRASSGLTHFARESGLVDTALNVNPRQTALGQLPESPDRFPVSLWTRDFLRSGIRPLALQVDLMRRPCSPLVGCALETDGSNLPLAVEDLQQRHKERYRQWLDHVRTVLPDMRAVTVRKREEDNYRYLVAEFGDRTKVPSWLLSDGMLRMLALTIVPYLPERNRVYLIEEPENGVHPQAIESVFDALSSVWENQVLLATHSPIVLGCAELADILCFSRANDGSVAITRGDRHPRLRDWKGEVDLATLYAAGALS